MYTQYQIQFILVFIIWLVQELRRGKKGTADKWVHVNWTSSCFLLRSSLKLCDTQVYRL